MSLRDLKNLKNRVFPLLYVPAGLKNLKNYVFPLLYDPAGLEKFEKSCFSNYSAPFLDQKTSKTDVF